MRRHEVDHAKDFQAWNTLYCFDTGSRSNRDMQYFGTQIQEFQTLLWGFTAVVVDFSNCLKISPCRGVADETERASNLKNLNSHQRWTHL